MSFLFGGGVDDAIWHCQCYLDLYIRVLSNLYYGICVSATYS
jgi:hypothetical protein